MIKTGVKSKNTVEMDARTIFETDVLKVYENTCARGLVDYKTASTTYNAVCDALVDETINDQEFIDIVDDMTAYDAHYSRNMDDSDIVSSSMPDYMAEIAKDKSRVLFCNTKKNIVGNSPDKTFERLAKFQDYFIECIDNRTLVEERAEKSLLNLGLKDFRDDVLDDIRDNVLIACHMKIKEAKETGVFTTPAAKPSQLVNC